MTARTEGGPDRKRSAENRLLEYVGADGPPMGIDSPDYRKHRATVRRLLRAVKAECAERAAMAALWHKRRGDRDDDTYTGVRAAVLRRELAR